MRRAPVAMTLLLLAAVGPPAWADEPEALRAAARVLPASDAESDLESAPVVVEARFPQYRGTGPASTAPHDSDTEAAALRFLMPLPRRVVLLEAAIDCDGLPYHALRRKRAAALLTVLEESASEAAANSNGAHASDNPDSKASAEPAQPSPPGEPDPLEKRANVENSLDEPTNATQAGDPEPDAALVDSSVQMRLQRYARATGRSLSVAEVEWFLTNWTDGPDVLVLRESFERVRATQQPVLIVLDADDSGGLTTQELKAAEEQLAHCDASRDGVLTYAELFSAADGLARTRPVRKSAATNPTFLLPVAGLSWPTIERRILPLYGTKAELPRGLSRFDADADGELDASEIGQLECADADIVLRAEFDGNDASKSHVVLIDVAERLQAATGEASASAILLPLASARIEFSAVIAGLHVGIDQVSIGAVHDGYPLLPLLDTDQNGQLTVRELRGAEARLRALDRNGDGAISAEEIVPTLRVAIGRGPCVHQHLVQLRSAAAQQSRPSVPVPDWFARMDANGDRDLTRSEFLGNDQQFAALDRDRDGLIDVTEAATMEH